MTDLVSELRRMHSRLAPCPDPVTGGCVRCRAADEIERLQAENVELRARIVEHEAERIEFLGEIIPGEYNRGVADGRAEVLDALESPAGTEGSIDGFAEPAPFRVWSNAERRQLRDLAAAARPINVDDER